MVNDHGTDIYDDGEERIISTLESEPLAFDI